MGVRKIVREHYPVIYNLYTQKGVSLRDLGRRFGVSHEAIRLILIRYKKTLQDLEALGVE